MPCDTRTLPNQTFSERKTEVRTALAQLQAAIAAGTVRPVVGKQGAIAFAGWLDQDRRRVSDACAYRLLMATASATTKLKIAQAEQLAGRTVNKQALAAGVHSHDQGVSWSHGHKH